MIKNYLKDASRAQKTMLLLIGDGFIGALCWLILHLRTDGAFPNTLLTGLIMMLAASAALSYGMGSSRAVLRATNLSDNARLVVVSISIGLTGALIAEALGIQRLAWSFGVHTSLFLLGAISFRIAASAALAFARRADVGNNQVIIYGAGAAGQQLRSALKASDQATAAAFVDDDPRLHGTTLGGVKIHSPDDLEKLVSNPGVNHVLVAIPSLSEPARQRIMEKLEPFKCKILILPPLIDLLAHENLVDALKPVDPADLLGRDAIHVDLPEIEQCFSGRVVMVTGAGGSIGSELCRQVMAARPACLVLYELSEYALYAIEMELRDHPCFDQVTIVPVLGSVCNAERVRQTLRDHDVNTILHAAAYKHVPLSEQNPLEVARNNVVGTKVVAEAAVEARVDRFILVSTDKAVRPTNLMGATKRFAEIIVQDLQARSPRTILSMVRFGNVLGSSGSVIPLFKRQIAEGGPVTVTHREITRYFMTIPEAAQLVLLAGTFSKGGDLFLLDMGEPVKIENIARRLIEMSGLRVRDAQNPGGDVEIRYTGIRPGEKLYEELLVDAKSMKTPHPKIMCAVEAGCSRLQIDTALRKLKNALDVYDEAAVRPLLKSIVPEYAPEDSRTDALPAIRARQDEPEIHGRKSSVTGLPLITTPANGLTMSGHKAAARRKTLRPQTA